jgi:hypothetical protein
MADVRALHAVGNSMAIHLRNSYPAELSAQIPCSFRAVSSGELASDDDLATAITLYLYRLTVNEHVRNVGLLGRGNDSVAPLSLDLHFLLSAWADNGLAEHTILAWAMAHLHDNPILDVSSLSPGVGFSNSDFVQLVPEQLSNEDLMRIWDALTPSYRLSFSYVARVVRIDGREHEEDRPVVARRFAYEDSVPSSAGQREGRP